MKQLRFLFNCFFVCCILAVACDSIYSLYWGYVYERNRNAVIALSDLNQLLNLVKNPQWFWLCYSNQTFLRGGTNLLALGALLSLWRFWRINPKTRFLSKISRIYQINKELLTNVRQSYRYVDWLTRGVIFLGGLMLIVATTAPLELVWTLGLRDLAYAADGMGFYEFGEQIYGLTSDSKGTTLASTCGMDGHDSDKKELESGRLNKKVEAMYGPLSLQMANRYSALGTHYYQNFDDNLAEQECCIKAIRIYRRLDRRLDCAKKLSFLAFSQGETGSREAARKSIIQSLTLLETSAATPTERLFVVGELDAAANNIGDQSCAEFVHTGVTQPQPKKKNPKETSLVVALKSIVMFFIVVILLREVFFSTMLACWKNELHAASEFEDKIRVLHKLLNLELARSDLDAADHYSKQLLRVADCSY